MCGGAIISDFIAPTSNRRLIENLLWPSDVKKNPTNYHSKPLRSEIVDLEDDFEADFQDFKDESDAEDNDFKSFAFSASKSGVYDGSRSPKSVKLNGHAEKVQRERGRINTEELGSAHGVNGLLKYETRGKGSGFGLELSTLLKKLQEPMMLRHARSGAGKLR